MESTTELCGCGRGKGHKGRCRNRRTGEGQIDLMLEILDMVRPPGVEIPECLIADICGCERQNIHQIMNKAMRKLRRAASLKQYQDTTI